MRFPDRPTRAFSLVELVLVVVIMSIVAAIAIPRFSDAAVNARAGALSADVSRVQKSIDLYIEEHNGRTPAHDEAGAVDTNAPNFIRRLLKHTDVTGLINDATGIYGPYLRDIPVNPNNALRTVRIDGPAAGAGTHGWHYDTASNEFLPDDAKGKQTMDEGRVRVFGGKGATLEAN